VALTGFHPVAVVGAGGSSPRQAAPRDFTSVQAAPLFERTALEAVNDEHPAPFDFTRLSAADEAVVALEDLAKLRKLSTPNRGGSEERDKAALFTDGPLDWALTVIAMMTVREKEEPRLDLIPRARAQVGETTLIAWKAAIARVRELPTGVRRWKTNSYDDGLGRNRDRWNYPVILRDDSLGRFYEAKTKQQADQMWPPMQRYTPNVTGLTDRIGVMRTVQALLVNTADFPRHTGARPEIRDRLGEQRHDLAVVLDSLLIHAVQAAQRSNSSRPGDLHRYFSYRYAELLATFMFRQRLLRKTALGDNWTDPDYEAALRLTTRVTAIMPTTTLDVVCHAPSLANLSASALTLENVKDLKPTVIWEDGTSMYLYDGVEMNPQLIQVALDKPSEIMNVRNVEQRRVLLRLVGADAVLKDVKAELVHQDDFGELYKLPNGAQFVMVNNATVEPDGTIRKYMMGCIGRAHVTARSGVASTFGLQEHQYWPAKET
jgi:hypothetical protein